MNYGRLDQNPIWMMESIKPLSTRLRGERSRAQRAGEVGVDGGRDRAAEAHPTLPIALGAMGPLPLASFDKLRSGEGRETVSRGRSSMALERVS